MSQVGVDLDPQSSTLPECTGWYFKADTALRIKYGFTSHVDLLPMDVGGKATEQG